MCERLGFEFFNVQFIDDDSMNGLPVNKKLGYMANYERANVGNKIFGLLNRSDFPDLFGAILHYGTYRDLYLDGMKIYPDKISFLLACNEGRTYFVEVPLAGTNGKFRVKKGGMRFAIIEWTNGEIKSFDRAIGDEFQQIVFSD